jgi:O-antigen/teichoic acid export membrane protein
LPTLIIIAVLIQRKQFKIMPFNKKLMTQYRLEILKVSLFGIMAGFSGVAVVNIDTIMTNYYLGLSISGIYAINFFLGNLVLLPSRSLRKISSIVISEAWKKNEIALISDIYYKSTINQLIIGIFLFGGIFINLDNLYIVIPEYALGKQALIILLVGFLLEMISGLSPIIMTTSVYYKYFALQILASFFVLILLCIIFIPIWGINGTAIAVSINLVIFILIRFYFLYKRFGFQPYNKSHLIIAAFGILALIASYAIPKFEHFAIDFFLRSTVFSLIFLIPVILSKISDNLNDVVNKIIFRLKKLAQKT